MVRMKERHGRSSSRREPAKNQIGASLLSGQRAHLTRTIISARSAQLSHILFRLQYTCLEV